MGRTKERNASIEVIRVIACFLVVVNHIQVVPVMENGMFFESRAFFYSIIQVNVPLFAIISGFLLFQNMDKEKIENLTTLYMHKIKNFLLYVFIPSVIIVVISAVFYSFIVEGKTIPEVFIQKNFQWQYLKDYIFLQNADYICNHLWYIWTYAKIIILFPLLAFICQDNQDKNRMRHFFMFCSLANLVFVDTRKFFGKVEGDFDNLVFDKYILYVLLGYELYILAKKESEGWKKYRRLGIMLAILGIAGKLGLESFYFSKYGAEYISDITTVLSSVGVFMALYSQKNPVYSKIWTWLGKNTLYVYMVHIIVMFCCINVWDKYFWNLCGAGRNAFSFLIYDVLYGAIIFSLSLIAGLIFKFVYENVILRFMGKAVKAMKKGE